MDNPAKILWKDKEVGTLANVTPDMWYLEADWLSNLSDHSATFEELASKLNADEVLKTPYNGLLAQLEFEGSSSSAQNVLILSLSKTSIFMRIVSDEVAAYADLNLMQPWRTTNSAGLYESELKKEVSFFHPLNWKKVRAIGIREDCDDVLFEVLTGRSKYAVVHLTYAKERSRKFPITSFYRNWEDVYKNRLLEDHREWKTSHP
jgi:hypothetical protein